MRYHRVLDTLQGLCRHRIPDIKCHNVPHVESVVLLRTLLILLGLQRVNEIVKLVVRDLEFLRQDHGECVLLHKLSRKKD